ncbi:MAG: selenocysteine-specific translation elongation factor, partial [Pyrinomonadaceae bacterium]
MLAGAHGIDAVALVIAADEGVMPQTREHFDICRLLGIRAGLVVITKADLAEVELIQLVRDEAEELVSGSFLEGTPMITVSAKAGLGLHELKQTMQELALNIPARSSNLVPRLPVDRAFTMRGFGPVVTGTLVSGELGEGDELELLPAALKVRARGIQVHVQSVARALAGQRTAVNLGGVDVAEIQRGMVLAPIGRLRPSQVIDAQLDVLPTAPRALRSRSRVRLHVHAAEVLGRIRVLNETGAIEPGGSGFAQLRLETPVVAVSGERFILRSYSPSQTIAGGQVLEPFANKHRGKDFAQVIARLEVIKEQDNRTQVSAFVAAAGDTGQQLPDLAARTGWNDKVLAKATTEAVTAGTIVNCDGVLIAPANFDRLCHVTVEEIRSHHKREPLARGLARETLRERHFAHVQPEVFRSVLARLEQQGLLVSEKDVVRARDHSLEVKGADADLRNQLAKIYEQAALEPPSLEEALQQTGLTKTPQAHGRKILQLLIDGGEVVRLQGELFFHRRALEELKRKLRKYGDAHEPSRAIDVAAFKDLAGVSRKYAIPLLEYLDRERVTRRAGDQRVILK